MPAQHPWASLLGFYCRLWQIQIEHTLRFWALLVAPWPKPTAKELAADAETLREIMSEDPAPPETRESWGAHSQKAVAAVARH